MSENILDIVQINPGRKGLNEFIKSLHLGIDSSNFEWINTTSKEKIPNLSSSFSGLGNTHVINDIPRINKFFEEASQRLEKGQYLLVCVKTKEVRKKKILNSYPKPIAYLVYLCDFFLSRILPKISITKKLYFGITKGENRVISLTESLGRLISCGFDVIGHQQIGYTTYILTQKKTAPTYDMEPTYGLLVKLKRIGKGGRTFDVYKFRTMHPYSEYLQDYVFSKNSLKEGGKIKDDFRVTNWGKLFRKLWIDELPMIINLFEGDMKLVGVRPLSKHYFNLYPKETQDLRIKVKPGLLPPFYADMPESLDEIIASEKRYLEAYAKNPVITDVKYFMKIFYNIIFKKARSS